MNNNILRTEKVKTRQQITSAAEHNFRLRTQSNIDDKKTPLNKIFVNTLNVDTKNASDLQIQLSKFYDGLGIKEKKDNVLMMEFVISASPEFFAHNTPQQVDYWAKRQVEFMKKEFGDQLKIAVLHVDEKTPHLHFMIGTEIQSVKKYKNQKGEFYKETWSLNAKRYDPEFLMGLHDRHAEWNREFNLKRGVRGSMREHKTLKEFYRMVDKAMKADYEKTIENVIEKMETGLLTGKVSIDEVREKFKPIINGVLKQNKALREKYAMDIKQWAADLSAKEIELEREKMQIATRKELFEDAIQTKIADHKLIEKQKEEISRVTAAMKNVTEENQRLRERYEPKKSAPVPPKTAKILGS